MGPAEIGEGRRSLAEIGERRATGLPSGLVEIGRRGSACLGGGGDGAPLGVEGRWGTGGRTQQSGRRGATGSRRRGATGSGRRGATGSLGSRWMGGWADAWPPLYLSYLYMMFDIDLWFAQGYKLKEQIKT
jgi:hypothetical protein